MLYNKSIIKPSTLCVLVSILFQSCHFGAAGTWKNDNIDSEIREEIRELNNKLFEGIASNDIKKIKSLMSDELLKEGKGEIDKLINGINSSIKEKNYKILDEYYVNNTASGLGNTLMGISGEENDDDYVINYKALNKEMYASLLLVPNGLNCDFLITAIYGKYDDEWKLNILLFGQYTIFGRTAPDYYKSAINNHRRSNIIDAVNDISLANACLSPATVIFHYEKETKIKDYYDRIIKEANAMYNFPIVLDKINSKPSIFRIYPEILPNEGYFTTVCYLTKINMDDSISLKKENELVKAEVNKIFKGINKDKKFVFYRASHEIPDGKKEVSHYGFIDTLKN